MTQLETDLLWLKQAYEVAKDSPDPRTQNGAILISKEGFLIGYGHNRFAKGNGKNVLHTDERWNTKLKYDFIVHAERSAIYDAAFCQMNIPGSTLYCPWSACAACALAIIECGVTRVVGHKTPLHDGRPDWEASIKLALEMFQETGVVFEEVEGRFGVKIRFNGQETEF